MLSRCCYRNYAGDTSAFPFLLYTTLSTRGSTFSELVVRTPDEASLKKSSCMSKDDIYIRHPTEYALTNILPEPWLIHDGEALMVIDNPLQEGLVQIFFRRSVRWLDSSVSRLRLPHSWRSDSSGTIVVFAVMAGHTSRARRHCP